MKPRKNCFAPWAQTRLRAKPKGDVRCPPLADMPAPSYEWAMTRGTNIPTDADFELARQAMANRDRDWDEIARIAKGRLAEICNLREFAIFPNDACRFSAMIFLPTEQEAEAARSNELELKARELLDQVIRPFRSEACDVMAIHVEIDSDENVRRRYGSYFNRLR